MTLGDLSLVQAVAAAFGLPFAGTLSVLVAVYLWNQLIRRLQSQQTANDAGTNTLINGSLGWAKQMQEWAEGVQKHLQECLDHHAECQKELSESREDRAMLRAQLGIKGVIDQKAQQIIAADAAARKEREG